MPRPKLIEDLAAEMFLSAGRFQTNVQEWEAKLYRIFDNTERKLFQDRARILSRIQADDAGRAIGTPAGLNRIDRLRDQVRQGIDGDLVVPGRAWADEAISGAASAGRDLARVNMSFDLIDRDAVREAFRNIRPAERAILQVGVRDTYRIMDTVGDDVADFFRDTFTEAAILGLPVQGRGDTIENRIFEGGRLKAQTIKTAEGKIIKRSLRQRAVAIARVETARVYNRVHESKAREILGDEAVFANANPEDSRTTEICNEASNQEPMTMAEWDKSKWGRPPRLRPDFHLCRSFLIGGTARMFEETNHPSVSKAVEKAKKDVAPKGPGEPPKEKPEAKFKREVEERIRKGMVRDTDYMEVGEMVRRRSKDFIDTKAISEGRARYAALRAERLKVMDDLAELGEEGSRIRSTPEYKAASEERQRELRLPLSLKYADLESRSSVLWKEMDAIEKNLKSIQTRATLDALKETRSFGHGANKATTPDWSATTPKEVRQGLDDASEFIPRDWLKTSKNHGSMKGRVAGQAEKFRGFYSHSTREFVISGVDEIDFARVATHEFGHRTESLHLDIMKAEEDFYVRRTAGDPILRYPGGEPGEVYKKDQWTPDTDYMGKYYYYNGKWYGFEILSMGLEDLAFGKYGFADKDPEVFRFVLGLLTAGGRATK